MWILLISHSIQRADYSASAFIQNMGVNHCCTEIRMTKQLLHCSNVVAVFKKEYIFLLSVLADAGEHHDEGEDIEEGGDDGEEEFYERDAVYFDAF